jgi:hypothetical protein
MRCIWLCKITSALLRSLRTCIPGSLGKQPELDLKTGPEIGRAARGVGSERIKGSFPSILIR